MSSRLQKPWMVETVSSERSPTWPTLRAAAASRSRISKAAFSVKVQSTISFGSALPSSRRFKARRTMLKVLPDPGPAITSNGPSRWPTTARWLSVSSG